MRTFWFQCHWLLGVSAGLILAVVGATGALMSFEPELMRWLNRDNLTAQAAPGVVLNPAQVLEALAVAEPERRLVGLRWSGTGENPAIGFAGSRKGDWQYVDISSGELLGPARGEGFFRVVEDLHRRLAAGEIGKALTGASTLILLVMAGSGLYLRWPREPKRWRVWLGFDVRRRGRAFLWDLHAVAGTWVLVFYLASALTGLYFAYDWYRAGVMTLAGVQRPAGREMPGAGSGEKRAENGEKRLDVSQKRGAGERGVGQGEGSQRSAGAPPMAQGLSVSEAIPIVKTAWTAFRQAVPEYSSASLRFPMRADMPVEWTYLDREPRHERAFNRLRLDTGSGALLEQRRYADQPAGARLIASIYPLHTGEYFGLTGRLLIFAASLAMPLFAVTGWMLYLDRRRTRRKRVAGAQSLCAAVVLPEYRENGYPEPREGEAREPWLVLHASQSGTASLLAEQSAAALRASGETVTLMALGELDRERLRQYRRVLFIVASFGDGEAPDSARAFVRGLMRQNLSLSGLRYGLLALGDRQYPRFCGFGRELDAWLNRQGAQSLFPRIDVDAGDPAALNQWRARLAEGEGLEAEALRWTPPAYGEAILVARRHLNPGSLGGAMFHLEFELDDRLYFESGDVVDLIPRHGEPALQAWLSEAGLAPDTEVAVAGERRPLVKALADRELPDPKSRQAREVITQLAAWPRLKHRHYSIASIPADGRVHLLVRQVLHKDGLGLASGWLTEYAALGQTVELRTRANPGFRLKPEAHPGIFIGNGSGLASLRSHLKARIAAGEHRNWLLFGERQQAHDAYYDEELSAWHQAGALPVLDRVYSRDGNDERYVQDRLRREAERLRAWVNNGAVIYVCGSADGMAQGVEQVLSEVFGADGLEHLIAEGRYRRDVY